MDTIVLDELGYLPSSKNGGQLLFYLLSNIYEKTSTLITTDLAFGKWPQVFGDARMAPALPHRMTHHCNIVETGDDSWRTKNETLLRNLILAHKRRHGRKRHQGPALTGAAQPCPPSSPMLFGNQADGEGMAFFNLWLCN